MSFKFWVRAVSYTVRMRTISLRPGYIFYRARSLPQPGEGASAEEEGFGKQTNKKRMRVFHVIGYRRSVLDASWLRSNRFSKKKDYGRGGGWGDDIRNPYGMQPFFRKLGQVVGTTHWRALHTGGLHRAMVRSMNTSHCCYHIYRIKRVIGRHTSPDDLQKPNISDRRRESIQCKDRLRRIYRWKKGVDKTFPVSPAFSVCAAHYVS